MAPKSKRQTWKEEESRLLIQVVAELKLVKTLDDKKTKKKTLFERVAVKLNDDHDVTRTCKQIETHWKFLRRTFHDNKLIALKSGEAAVRWNLMVPMQELIGDRPLAQAIEDGVESIIDEFHEFIENEIDSVAEVTNKVESPLDQSLNSPCSSENSDDLEVTGKRKFSIEDRKQPSSVKRSQVADQVEKAMEVVVVRQGDALKDHQDRYISYLEKVRSEENQRQEDMIKEEREWNEKVAKDAQEFEEQMMILKSQQTKELLSGINEAFLKAAELMSKK